MSIDTFFDSQTKGSLAKTNIVENYFKAWSSIIINTLKKHETGKAKAIAYIDLFAGPGKYEDGTNSTPLKILEYAVANEEVRNRIITLFNDSNESETLKSEIGKVVGINSLKYAPVVMDVEVGNEFVDAFNKVSMAPTLLFIDPFGYKGVSVDLIASVLKDWGSDCIFFFNYNRINSALNNQLFKKHMIALFGAERVEILQKKLEGLKPFEREQRIIESLCESLRENGGRYILPFRFMSDTGKRLSHHLILVSKHFKAYDEMKTIMAKAATSDEEGVATFTYNPADCLNRQALLFLLARPMQKLKEEMLLKYSGKRLGFEELYYDHSINTPYIRKNYREALTELIDSGKISVIKADGKKPRRGTFGPDVKIVFP